MDNNQPLNNPNNFGGQPVPPSNLPKTDEQPSGEQNPINTPSMPSGNPFEQGAPASQGASDIPAPPSNEEENVAVRTMKSDSESIKQTGGDMPKSEIVTAPDINIGGEEQNTTPQQPNTPIQSQQPNQPEIETQQTPPPSNIPPQEQAPQQPEQPKSSGGGSSILKTILIIVGIVILAGAIGFGVYYLISSLNKTPEIPTNNNTQNENTLPIVNEINNEENKQTATSTVETEPAFTHTSIISSPDSSATVSLEKITLDNLLSGISSTTVPLLAEGEVKDLSFYVKNEESERLLESSEILNLYFPQIFSELAPLFKKDFTSWIYYDKINSIVPKLGYVFELEDGLTIDEVIPAVSLIESDVEALSKIFIDEVEAPESPEFDDGAVEDMDVRFLFYSTGNVLEYGWLKSGERIFLVIGTSYKQMVDIVSKLSNN